MKNKNKNYIKRCFFNISFKYYKYFRKVINQNIGIMKELLIIILSLLFLSCGIDRIYTSGTYGSIKSYTAKPEYRNKDTSAVYISGDYNKSMYPQFGGYSNSGLPQKDKEDIKNLISLTIHKSITRENFNFFYGAGGAYGNYIFKSDFFDIVKANEKKSFYSFNTKIGFNYNLPTKKMDWRIIGLELGYNYEFGSYQNTLKLIKERTEDLPRILVVNEKSIFSYNFNSEAIFKLQHNNAFGIGFFVGDVLNNPKELKNRDSSFYGLFFSYKHKKYTLSFIREIGAEVKSSKLGLSYQLF